MMMIFLPFVALLGLAAIFDLLTMTIPNWLCAGVVLLFFPTALIGHLPPGALPAQIGCGLTVLAATFLMFQFGWLGGGDAKLAAAIALWLGWSGLPSFLSQTALWGGALAVTLLFLRVLVRRFMQVNQLAIGTLLEPGAGAPYGVALALGGVLSLPDSALWRLSGAA